MSARKKIAPKAQPKNVFTIPGLFGCEAARRSAPAAGLLTRLWRWLGGRFSSQGGGRRLQVTATVPLGEKRFVAVVKVDGREFLVGGGASNVALLSPLESDTKTFSQLLGQSTESFLTQPLPPVKKRSTRRSAETAPAAKRQSSRTAADTTKKTDAGRSVRMPRLSAQLNVAPALGHFIKPQLKGAPLKTQKKSSNRVRKQA